MNPGRGGVAEEQRTRRLSVLNLWGRDWGNRLSGLAISRVCSGASLGVRWYHTGKRKSASYYCDILK